MDIGATFSLPLGNGTIVGVSWTSPRIGASSSSSSSSSSSLPGDLLIVTKDKRVEVHDVSSSNDAGTADESGADTVTQESSGRGTIVASWQVRPGSSDRFTTAAVQNRQWRRFFVVQDGSKLLAWHESVAQQGDAWLKLLVQQQIESAIVAPSSGEGPIPPTSKVRLRSDAYSLLLSHKVPALACVFKDGGIAIFDERLRELYSAAAPADGSVVTWTRLTSIPGQAGKCILMVLSQQLSPASTTEGSVPGRNRSGSFSSLTAAVRPVLRIYILSTTAGSGAATVSSISLKFVSAHVLLPPVEAQASELVHSSRRVVAITLHKALQQLCVIWSTGHLQILRFAFAQQHSQSRVQGFGSSAGAWITGNSYLSEVLVRHIARLIPSPVDYSSSSSSTVGDSVLPSSSSSSSSFNCAAFAIEPACLVLAGVENDRESASYKLSTCVSVWDIKHGVMLGVKRVDDDDPVDRNNESLDSSLTAIEEGGAGVGSKRKRGRSSPTLQPQPPKRDRTLSSGSLQASAQALFPAAIGTDAVFQVTVSEDGSFAALVSARRVTVVPVAVHARGTTLSAALGRFPATQSMLAKPAHPAIGLSTSGGVFYTANPMPTVSLSRMLSEASGSNSASTGKSFAAALDTLSSVLRKDCAAILDPVSTPTAESIIEILRKNGFVMEPRGLTMATMLDGSSASSAKGKGKSSKKSVVTTASSSSSAPITPSLGYSDSSLAKAMLSDSLVLCCLQRIVSEIYLEVKKAPKSGRRMSTTLKVDATTASGIGLTAISPILQSLLKKGVVSAVANADLIPALLLSASAAQNSSSADALSLLSDSLVGLADVPEAVLVTVFSTLARGDISNGTLASFWNKIRSGDSVNSSDGKGKSSNGPQILEKDGQLALLFLTGLIVRSPRNDVFLEAALQKGLGESPDSLLLLLAILLRLVNVHVHEVLGTALVPVSDSVDLEKNVSIPSSRTGNLADQSRPGVVLLPSFGQVLDWLRMTLDSHYAKLVLLARADAQEGSSGLVCSLLRDASKIVKRQISICDVSSDLKGLVEHLLRKRSLPQPPAPDVSVEVLRF